MKLENIKNWENLPEDLKAANNVGPYFSDFIDDALNTKEVWIARDKDGELNVYWESLDWGPLVCAGKDGCWWAWWEEGERPHINIDKNLFPEITFENSPKKAEMHVNLKK